MSSPWTTQLAAVLAEAGTPLNDQGLAALDYYFAHRCIIVWSVADVHTAAEIEGRVLDDDEACQVLSEIEQGHDANTGMNWDVLQGWVRARGRPMTEAERDERDRRGPGIYI